MKKFFAVLLFGILAEVFFGIFPPQGFPQEVVLSWDTTPSATEYQVYWGEESGNLKNPSPRTTETSYTIRGLPDKKIYFGVKAFNYCGNNSEMSEEVSNCDLKSSIDSPGNFKVDSVNINININLPGSP